MKIRRKGAPLGGRIKKPVEDQNLFALDRAPEERLASKFRNAQVKTHVVCLPLSSACSTHSLAA
jgi:hypothetical protein